MTHIEKAKKIVDSEVFNLANSLVNHIFATSDLDDEDVEFFNEYPLDEDGNRDVENPQEVMQWFIVSSWLAHNLIKEGEPVLQAYNVFFWGRTCVGQSLEMDHVLQRIAA